MPISFIYLYLLSTMLLVLAIIVLNVAINDLVRRVKKLEEKWEVVPHLGASVR